MRMIYPVRLFVHDSSDRHKYPGSFSPVDRAAYRYDLGGRATENHPEEGGGSNMFATKIKRGDLGPEID